MKVSCNFLKYPHKILKVLAKTQKSEQLKTTNTTLTLFLRCTLVRILVSTEEDNKRFSKR
jgi:hypothetical protein